MFAVKKSLRGAKRRFNAAAVRCIASHPLLGFILIFVGIPLLIPGAVLAGTAVAVLPLALACGWC